MKRFSPDQIGVLRNGAVGLAVALGVGVPIYLWMPASWLGIEVLADAGERIAFAARWDIPVLVWLAVCIRQVSGGRFKSPADIGGSALSEASPAIAISRAILQNSLEQTVLAIGAHFALAATLRGRELIVVPILVTLFLAGRVWFAVGYRGGAPGRAGGMVLTAAPTIVALLLAGGLALAGR
ncbi:MAPEG family protein [Phenylobacterium sp.]|uniref:MAPEG family protein n=1 Tax=Phenylobacterium sp. TaxID=1871053 RepID=UPI0035B18744